MLHPPAPQDRAFIENVAVAGPFSRFLASNGTRSFIAEFIRPNCLTLFLCRINPVLSTLVRFNIILPSALRSFTCVVPLRFSGDNLQCTSHCFRSVSMEFLLQCRF